MLADQNFADQLSFIEMRYQTVDQPCQCRFAASASSAEYNTFAVSYGQINSVYTVSRAVLAAVVEIYAFECDHAAPPVTIPDTKNQIPAAMKSSIVM